MESAPGRRELKGIDVAIACAIVATAVVATALTAMTKWRATEAGQALRLWGVAIVLGAVVIVMRGRAVTREGAANRWRPPSTHPITAQAIVGGLGLGGLMALGNVMAVRGATATPELRYPFGKEAIGLWSAIAVVGIVAPIVEELFFRGILLRYLWATRGAAVAVIVSAAAFALGHGEPGLMPQAALGGG